MTQKSTWLCTESPDHARIADMIIVFSYRERREISTEEAPVAISKNPEINADKGYGREITEPRTPQSTEKKITKAETLSTPVPPSLTAERNFFKRDVSSETASSLAKKRLSP